MHLQSAYTLTLFLPAQIRSELGYFEGIQLKKDGSEKCWVPYSSEHILF